MGFPQEQHSNASPLVTVVIPCRNEEAAIERALDAIAAQDYPLSRLEVVVVDGGSTDETAIRAKEVLASQPFARAEVLFNEKGTTPSNLNAGLAVAIGEIIVRVDARSLLPRNYVSAVVGRLSSDESVAVVGGSQVARPPEDSLRGRAIGRALNNRYGMGLSRYRRHGAASGIVDTVYLGVFRRSELVEAGGWNEEFSTNQDFELNQRMQEIGSVWFEAGLPVGYVPRRAVGALWSQYRRFGSAKASYWRQPGHRPNRRQMALLIVPPVVAGASIGAFAALGTAGRFALASGAGLSLLAVDRLGAEDAPGSWAEAGIAASVSAVVGAGWWSGVVQGLLSGGSLGGPTR